MKFQISITYNCRFSNGHFYYKGQKVKLNIDKLIVEYKAGKQMYGQAYIDNMNELRNNIFTINFISAYYPSCTLEEFWHILDLDDLILIK